MQPYLVAFFLILASLSGCAEPLPRRPESPIEVLASTSNSQKDWAKVAAENRPSVLAIVVERGSFDSASNYGDRLWTSTKRIVLNPFSGIPDFLVNLFFGYLDFSYVEGSGFVISKEGHFLTNAHVVENGERFVAKLGHEKRWRKAEVIAVAPDYDLALMKIVPVKESPEEFRPTRFQEPKEVGEALAILGFPSRPWSEGANPITMTQGIVSSLKVPVGEIATRFQTDAATNAGASGSPIFNRQGNVIGIVLEHARPSIFEDQSFGISPAEMQKAGFIRFKLAPKTKATGQ